MKRIAVLTDLSDRSAIAIQRAAFIASATGAEPVLIHAIDDNLPKHVLQRRVTEAEETLRQEAAPLAPSVRFEVATGDVFWALHSAATRLQADLVLTGDHRRNPIRDLFADTTVERLIHVSAIPVLIARVSPTQRYRTAVVAIESAEGQELVDRLADLGQAGPERMILLHAVSMPAEGMMYYAGVDSNTIDEYRSEVFMEARARVGGIISPGALKREVQIEEGIPATVIEKALTDEGSDLVVLSAHARRAALRGFLGSVSSSAIRRGTTDVLIVPRVV